MHTVVAAALYQRGEVLLCQRAATRRWYPDVWDFPGGHVEPGESGWSALVREVREELAVELPLVDVPPLPSFQVVGDDVQLSIWKVESWVGDPMNAAPDEHDAIAWFTLADALALPLAHPDYPALLAEFVP